ncbi:MAG: membrane protein FxsA [Desulfuromonadales bacterium]|nr:membrane protein FxsA [Desulfuromonadales bacterium]
MFIRLLILFTCIPLLELYVLIEAGRQIGLFSTILLILLTGVAGAWLARTQGVEIVRRIQIEMEQGRMPGEVLLDGAMILVGGLLLLTPGFCTDLVGFTFLAPFSRNFWRGVLSRWVQRNIEQGSIHIHRY